MGPVEQTMTEQFGWILVKYVGEARSIRYLYVTTGGIFDWSENPSHALRLARREDGDAITRVIEDADAIVEEHAWQ